MWQKVEGEGGRNVEEEARQKGEKVWQKAEEEVRRKAKGEESPKTVEDRTDAADGASQGGEGSDEGVDVYVVMWRSSRVSTHIPYTTLFFF